MSSLFDARLGSESSVNTVEKLGLLSDLPILKRGTPIDTVNLYTKGQSILRDLIMKVDIAQ
jgi:hypothetical protein